MYSTTVTSEGTPSCRTNQAKGRHAAAAYAAQRQRRAFQWLAPRLTPTATCCRRSAAKPEPRADARALFQGRMVFAGPEQPPPPSLPSCTRLPPCTLLESAAPREMRACQDPRLPAAACVKLPTHIAVGLDRPEFVRNSPIPTPRALPWSRHPEGGSCLSWQPHRGRGPLPAPGPGGP